MPTRNSSRPLRRRYQQIVERRGVTPDAAARWLRTRHGIAAAMLLEAGHADAALCGGLGDWLRQYKQIAAHHSAQPAPAAPIRCPA